MIWVKKFRFVYIIFYISCLLTIYKICFNISGREDLVIAPFKRKIVAKEFKVMPNEFTENCVTFHQKIKGKFKIPTYIHTNYENHAMLRKLNFNIPLQFHQGGR